MDDWSEHLQQRVRGFFPDTLGLKVTSATPERITAELFVRDDLCTVPGVMHGGAVMAFADTLGAMGTVLNLPEGKGYGTTTLESKTNFIAAGVAGTTVTGESIPIHRGGRTMVWQTTIRRPDGGVIAIVTQTQMVLEPKRSPEQQMAALFEGKPPAEQKALLASLERAGAALYRSLAEQESNPDARAQLLAAADREEANAQGLEAQAGR